MARIIVAQKPEPTQEFYIERSRRIAASNKKFEKARQDTKAETARRRDAWNERAKPGWLSIIFDQTKDDKNHTPPRGEGRIGGLTPGRAAAVSAILIEQAQKYGEPIRTQTVGTTALDHPEQVINAAEGQEPAPARVPVPVAA